MAAPNGAGARFMAVVETLDAGRDLLWGGLCAMMVVGSVVMLFRPEPLSYKLVGLLFGAAGFMGARMLLGPAIRDIRAAWTAQDDEAS